MSDVVLREFLWSDLGEVHALWLACFRALKPEDAPEALRRCVDRDPGLFLLALEDDRVVGSVLGTTDGRRGFLYHVAVLPERRRRDIASRLVREVTARLFARGLTTVHLRVDGANDGAIAFYRTLGFTADPPILGMRISR